MKAKDLRGRNIEDIDNAGSEPEEEDAVAAAYENISKKLESIRQSKDDEDSEDKGEKASEEKEVELEEWKGPRPPKPEELRKSPAFDDEEDEKVNLRNLEDPKESSKSKDDDEDEIDPLDDEDDEDESSVKKESEEDDSDDEDTAWKPKENDPLDDEEETAVSKDKQSLPSDEGEEDEDDLDEEIQKDDDEEEEKPEGVKRFEVQENVEEEADLEMPRRREPQPDTLDDLAEESGHHSRPMAGGSGDDDEYYIPNLRGSRQEGSDLSYNTPPQREGLGQSYAPRGNAMEGNDPNNFFSQHQQPQAPKRANKFHLLVLVLIGIGVIGFTVYILKGGFGNINIGTAEPSPSPTAAATPEATPTPTPEPEIERGNFTVRVLNGTDTSGLAKTVSDSLKADGYKTANPGNATEKDVEQTKIRVKEGTESAALSARLILDLAPDYEAVEGDKLENNAAYDAEVIVGTK